MYNVHGDIVQYHKSDDFLNEMCCKYLEEDNIEITTSVHVVIVHVPCIKILLKYYSKIHVYSLLSFIIGL